MPHARLISLRGYHMHTLNCSLNLHLKPLKFRPNLIYQELLRSVQLYHYSFALYPHMFVNASYQKKIEARLYMAQKVQKFVKYLKGLFLLKFHKSSAVPTLHFSTQATAPMP